MVQYLHFRILKFPLIMSLCMYLSISKQLDFLIPTPKKHQSKQWRACFSYLLWKSTKQGRKNSMPICCGLLNMGFRRKPSNLSTALSQTLSSLSYQSCMFDLVFYYIISYYIIYHITYIILYIYALYIYIYGCESNLEAPILTIFSISSHWLTINFELHIFDPYSYLPKYKYSWTCIYIGLFHIYVWKKTITTKQNIWAWSKTLDQKNSKKSSGPGLHVPAALMSCPNLSPCWACLMFK